MDKTRGALLVFMPLLVFLPATLALSNLREVVGLALAKTNNGKLFSLLGNYFE